MHCPQCGEENAEDSNFCRHCGTPLSEKAAPAPAPAAATPAAVESPLPASPESLLWEGHPSIRTLVPLLLLLLAVYGLLAAGLYWASGRFGPQAPQFWSLALPVALITVGFLLLAVALRHLIRLRSVRYKVTTQRLFIEHGILSKRLDEVELEHYKDITVSRSVLDRLVGCGDIHVMTTDPTHTNVTLVDIHDPVEKKEILRTAVEARKRALRIVRRQEL